LEATRRSFNKDFLLALAADFKKHGAAAIEKVRKTQPAAYMKICALLVPREMQIEHSGTIKQMSDEQIEQAIEAIQTMLAARAGEAAKVIEGEAEVVPSLPAPARRTKGS
jgi:2-oxoglutarate dehydrogenase complex dehydrogenase (E1) component-like enzyme